MVSTQGAEAGGSAPDPRGDRCGDDAEHSGPGSAEARCRRAAIHGRRDSLRGVGMSNPETRAVRELAVSKRAFSLPARTLADAVRLCDPFSPLDPREDESLHEDLSRIRGGD